MQKSELRKKFLERRNSIPVEEQIRRSRIIVDKVKRFKNVQQCQTISLYVSKGSEVRTHELIEWFLTTTNKTIAIPKVNGESLDFYVLDSMEKLVPGSFGILEPSPSECRKIGISPINAFIIPGVCFDEEGYRLGYGKGYFDRVLKQTKNSFRVALSYECLVVDKLPREEHDEKVNAIVTEKRIIMCIS
jgi:5-formyltetrahydrofolate cyclo-ligase